MPDAFLWNLTQDAANPRRGGIGPWGGGRVLSSSPFSPLSLNPALWLKADAGTWQTSALATPAASDGDRVGGLVDQSASAAAFTQATAGNRATLKTNVQNGLPAVRFVPNQALNLVAFSALDGVTSASVFCVFSVVNPGGGSQFVVDMAGNRMDIELSAGVLYLNVSASAYATAAFTATSKVLLEIVYDGTKTGNANRLKAWINGVPQTLNFPGAAVPASLGTGGDYTLGALNGGGSLFSSCDICEYLLYTPAPSDANRLNVEGYLNGRWGLF